MFSVIVLLAAGGGSVVWYRAHAAYVLAVARHKALICPGLPDTAGNGFQLTWTSEPQEPDKQCIGWTVSTKYVFNSPDPTLATVISEIVGENNKVAATSGPYVRIALLMPIFREPDSPLTSGVILHALEGAYVAQMQANSVHSDDDGMADSPLRIQLVLAGDGSNQDLWQGVVADLGTMAKDSRHPLVAVTGLGVSVADTRAAAARLQQFGIPTVGAVLTADDMTTRGLPGMSNDTPAFFKVSTSNVEYVQALKDVLTAVGAPQRGYLLYDSNSDEYVQTLDAAFRNEFGKPGKHFEFDLGQREGSFIGSTTQHVGAPTIFDDRVNQIGVENVTVILYAGRDADLPRLVRALAHRPVSGPLTPVIIATGTTGLVVDTTNHNRGSGDQTLTEGDLDYAHVGILDASTTDPKGWAANPAESTTPTKYAHFSADFLSLLNGLATASDLYDGYAIMHHDAMLAAIVAARGAFAANAQAQPNQSGLADVPSGPEVRYQLTQTGQFDGAGGQFSFEDQNPPNDLWPISRPTPVLLFGLAVNTPQWQWAVTKVQPTACEKLADPANPVPDYLTTTC